MRFAPLALFSLLLGGCVFTPSHATEHAIMHEDVALLLENPRRQSDDVRLEIRGRGVGTFALFREHSYREGHASRLRDDTRRCLADHGLHECKNLLSVGGALFDGVFTKGAEELVVETEVNPTVDFDAEWHEDWDGYVYLIRLDEEPSAEPFLVDVSVESTDWGHGSEEVAIRVLEAN